MNGISCTLLTSFPIKIRQLYYIDLKKNMGKIGKTLKIVSKISPFDFPGNFFPPNV